MSATDAKNRRRTMTFQSEPKMRRKKKYYNGSKDGQPICPKCKKAVAVSCHHIFPQRFFGGNKVNPHRIIFCEKCHAYFEKILPKHKLAMHQYLSYLADFISNTSIYWTDWGEQK
jgi:transcription elongation factor Elf1